MADPPRWGLKKVEPGVIHIARPEYRIALPKLEGSFAVEDPRLSMKRINLPVTGSARAALARPALSSELSTRFDESNVRVKLAIEHFAPPALGLGAFLEMIAFAVLRLRGRRDAVIPGALWLYLGSVLSTGVWAILAIFGISHSG